MFARFRVCVLPAALLVAAVPCQASQILDVALQVLPYVVSYAFPYLLSGDVANASAYATSTFPYETYQVGKKFSGSAGTVVSASVVGLADASAITGAGWDLKFLVTQPDLAVMITYNYSLSATIKSSGFADGSVTHFAVGLNSLNGVGQGSFQMGPGAVSCDTWVGNCSGAWSIARGFTEILYPAKGSTIGLWGSQLSTAGASSGILSSASGAGWMDVYYTIEAVERVPEPSTFGLVPTVLVGFLAFRLLRGSCRPS